MATEIHGLRMQTLANAKLLINPTSKSAEPFLDNVGSQSTYLQNSGTPFEGMDVVVFGMPATPSNPGGYVAALMMDLEPVIEGGKAPNPEAAMRKLFLSTCELLDENIPKVGVQHKSMKGGGVYNADMMSPLLEKARKDSLEAERKMSVHSSAPAGANV